MDLLLTLTFGWLISYMGYGIKKWEFWAAASLFILRGYVK